MNIGFLNFYMSAIRNMFLTSSIAIAMLGFSDKFTSSNKIMITYISVGIVCLSIFLGYKSTKIFNIMMKKALSESKDYDKSQKEIFNESKVWPVIAYVYILFLFLVLFANLTRIMRIQL